MYAFGLQEISRPIVAHFLNKSKITCKIIINERSSEIMATGNVINR